LAKESVGELPNETMGGWELTLLQLNVLYIVLTSQWGHWRKISLSSKSIWWNVFSPVLLYIEVRLDLLHQELLVV